MISLSKIKDLIKKDPANTHAEPPTHDEASIPAPVQVQPRTSTKPVDEPPTSAFATKPPGDTQELDGDDVAEQMDGLKRTLEAKAFESKEDAVTKDSSPFGNAPPTVEMERPDFPDSTPPT